MKGKVGRLLEQAPMQRGNLALQVLHRSHERADRSALGMESRILAGDVILDEPGQIAVEILVCDPLPGREIQPGLVEHASQTLPVLRDEARHQAARHHGADEQQAINESTDE